MRTIETTVYSFDELNDSAKEKAIENIRESYYRYNDFSEYVLDDCYLLEPLELRANKEILIENNRKIYYSLNRDRHIDISKAMEIQDSRLFLKWLGIDDDLIDKVDYTILKDEIEFSNQSDDEFTDDEITILEDAEIKFNLHCQDILNSIEESIDYCFSDESIIEDIYANELEFTEDGNRI